MLFPLAITVRLLWYGPQLTFRCRIANPMPKPKTGIIWGFGDAIAPRRGAGSAIKIFLGEERKCDAEN